VFPWKGLDSWGNLVAHALLLHGFNNTYAHAIDGAFWSLSLEWQFYLLFPIFVWVCRKSIMWGVVLPFMVSLLFRIIVYFKNHMWLHTYVGNEFCLGRWSEFGCGVMAAMILAGDGKVFNSPPVIRSFFKAFTMPAFLISALLTAIVLQLVRPGNFMMPLAWGTAFGSLVGFACLNETGWLRRFLSWKPLVWLGSISYSVYLLHGAIFQLLAIWVSNSSMSLQERACVFMILAPPLVLALSYLFFCFCERPFMVPPAKQSPLSAKPCSSKA
jgi:peptidoglycan/LPS O-acetylase OafA/YrhL